MAPENSDPTSCCCSPDDEDKIFSYVVTNIFFLVPGIRVAAVDAICPEEPADWRHVVNHSTGQHGSDIVSHRVSKRQNSIEVTFSLNNAITGTEKPCELFRPVRPPAQPTYIPSSFFANFEAKKVFPVAPFPNLRSGKRIKIGAKIRHSVLGKISGHVSSSASIVFSHCGKGYEPKPWSRSYHIISQPSCTTHTCVYPGEGYLYPETTIHVTSCQSSVEELDETDYGPLYHVLVRVYCNYFADRAFYFPRDVQTKFTVSVEEVAA
jgi:hypothetical protein